MAVVNGYCTLAQLRGQFNDDDAKLPVELLERAINASSRAVDRWCGFPLRKFWLDALPTARRYAADDPEVLDVADLGSAEGLEVATGDGFGTIWEPADYQLEPLDADQLGTAFAWTRIVAVGDRQFPTLGRRAAVQVTARHGWSAVPAEVEQATILKAASLFKRREAPAGFFAAGTVGGIDFGPVRITQKDGDVINLLYTYLRVTVGAVGRAR